MTVYTREFARDYAHLRPVDDGWWRVFDAMVDVGDLAGRRVLDVGCGTGTFAEALAARGADVYGVDASAEMLEQAWGRGLARDRGVHGRAEELPFAQATFERAVMRLVVHQVDRGRALPELRRVLVSGGRAVVATFDPDGFHDFWLTRLFPEVRDLDLERFPSRDTLEQELAAAGFDRVVVTRYVERGALSRDEALERVRGRFISTLRLVGDEAFARGLARAHAELPPRVEFERPWLLVSADRD